MILEQFHIQQCLSEGEQNLIYRATRLADQKKVILKTHRAIRPSVEEIHRFLHEYEIIKQLQGPGIATLLELIHNADGICLVFADEDLIPLNQILTKHIFTVQQGLALAIQLVQILHHLHEHKILHKDINPANICLTSDYSRAVLVDFEISSRLNQEHQQLTDLTELQGTLGYISPEQTGRMNRIVDYRSDYYSLGATLYEVFTGQPLVARVAGVAGKTGDVVSDAIAKVHFHIAKLPTPLTQLNPSLELMIEKIILKLLEKAAEDRYQSSAGIRKDLENCLGQLLKTGKIEEFELASEDYTSRLSYPQKLYGREAEVNKMLSLFQAACEGSKELLLVAGVSGVGKTVIVQEVHKPMTEKNAHFITGKAEQFKAGIPYAPVIASLQQLIRQILTCNQMELLEWKLCIKDAVKMNGAVLFEVLPELELILEEQPPVEELSPIEAQNRFFMVLLDFVSCFGRASSPLVFFFDDLQWAEMGTFEFIERLLTEEKASHIFVIGAYRHNEVASHPTLQAALNRFEEVSFRLNKIDLDSLDVGSLVGFLSDYLHLPAVQVEELAQLCYKKTAGNPFFFKQFLLALYQAEHLSLDAKTHQWGFDLQDVINFECTGNVLDLMAQKVGKIPAEAQERLKVASVFGVKFNLALLAEYFEEDPIHTLQMLLPTLDEGIILPLGDQYKFAGEGADFSKVNFCFLHDRVQQATYLLLDMNAQELCHLKIARLFHKQKGATGDLVYDIMNHYNKAHGLLRDKEEIHDVVRNNFIAGKKAMRSAAFRYALRYFEAAISLMQEEQWETNHSFAFTLYLNAAETAYLTYQHQKVAKFFKVLHAQAKTVLDESKIFEIKIPALISESKLTEAINAGLEILAKLGCPLNPTKANLLLSLAQVKLAVKRRGDISSASIGKMTDPTKLAAMDIMGKMGFLAYCINRDLLAMLIFKSIYYTVKYGVSPLSSFLMAGYAFSHAGPLRNLQQAREYAMVAEDYFRAQGNKKVECKTLQVTQGLVWTWLQPFKETATNLAQVTKIGLQNGDFEYASNSAIISLGHLIFPGLSLFQYQQQLVILKPSVYRFKNSSNFLWFKLQNQIVENYMGKVDFPTLIDGDCFQEKEDYAAMEQGKDIAGLCIFYHAKGLLNYDFGNYQEALEWFQKTKEIIDSQQGAILEVAYCYFSSLTALANVPFTTGGAKKKLLRWVKKNQKLSQVWAKECPENHLHSYYLVEAELARVTGQYIDAQHLYDKAITAAQKHDIPQWVALANEKAGEFFIEQGIQKLAHFYLKEAHYQYIQWGGVAKCQYLQQKYEDLLGMHAETSQLTNLGYAVTTIKHTDSLDLESIFKASQALSGEIRLEKLVENLTRIMIQNAGASRGVLITLEKQMMVRADISIEEDASSITEPIFAEGYADLPMTVVNQAQNLLRPVILGNSRADSPFVQDPYFQSHIVKSLACIPILHKTKLLGLIYLENRFAYDSIPPDRIQALQILCSQAAISMENAKLYHGLEEQVADRTQDLHQSLTKVEAANQNIMDSINYAQKIQDSLLPSLDLLKSCFPNYMVLWEPRDTVGGDIYFCEEIGDFVCLAVMDCTGHGVPGALMTMLAASGIRRIVGEEHCLDPALILSRLGSMVQGSLYHKDTIDASNDGLDAAVIIINQKTRSLKFAGAMMNLYKLKDGVMTQIKGDRSSIGYRKPAREKPFQMQEISLEKGEKIYMMTDGLQDQVGSTGFPLGRKKVLAWLMTLEETPMYRQRDLIMQELRNFMGAESRRDDITVIGFEVK